MCDEKRKEIRRPLNKPAKLSADPRAPASDCAILEISSGGVRLQVFEAKVPEHFILVTSNDDTVRRACRVVWRSGDEVGAEFG